MICKSQDLILLFVFYYLYFTKLMLIAKFNCLGFNYDHCFSLAKDNNAG